MYVFLVETSPHAKKKIKHTYYLQVYSSIYLCQNCFSYTISHSTIMIIYGQLPISAGITLKNLLVSYCIVFFFSLMTLLYNSPVYVCVIYVENTTKNTIAPCSISQCLQDRCALIQIDCRFKATEQKFKFYIDDYY